MSTLRKCPQCAADLPSYAPPGICVRCLLELAKETTLLPDATAEAPPNAHLLADYELIEMVGRGGMGVVYKARQISLGRQVALKMIRSAVVASELELQRFEMEARAAAMLDHPNIVPIYEVGEQEGQHYFTMRLVEGENLAERLRVNAAVPTAEAGRVRQNSRQAALLVRKLARAIHHAHQRGILHRDIKPSNILLDQNGEPQITDFGLAKLASAEEQTTLTHELLGTPEYMSPEQVTRQKQVTTATDVYSLGVILYELMTGRVPFRGGTPYETMRQVVENSPIRPTAVNPKIPRDLETICLKCLKKEPQHRYDSAAALADDLDRWLARKPIGARRTPPWERVAKWVQREPLKAALVALLLVGLSWPFFVSNFYRKQFSHMATEHPVVTPDIDGVYSLRIIGKYSADRCTENFWKGPMERSNRVLRLEFTNMPADMLESLRCVIRADIANMPDPARTPVLTNGQIFSLRVQSELERDFYVASVGWYGSNILARASNATVRLRLIE
jgi:serine/threonine protein kinase